VNVLHERPQLHSKYAAEHNAKDGDVLDAVAKHGRGSAMNATIQQLQGFRKTFAG